MFQLIANFRISASISADISATAMMYQGVVPIGIVSGAYNFNELRFLGDSGFLQTAPSGDATRETASYTGARCSLPRQLYIPRRKC